MSQSITHGSSSCVGSSVGRERHPGRLLGLLAVALCLVFVTGSGPVPAQGWPQPWQECMPEPGAPGNDGEDGTVAVLAVVSGPDEAVPDVEAAPDERPFLGVYLVEPDGALAEGVVVEECVSGGPADRAGLLPGDRIVQLAGQEVAGPDDLLNALADCEVGQRVAVVFVRDGERWRTKARLQAAPEDVELAPMPVANPELTQTPAEAEQEVESTADREERGPADVVAAEQSTETPEATGSKETTEPVQATEPVVSAEPVGAAESPQRSPVEAMDPVLNPVTAATPAARGNGWLGVLVDEFEDGRLVVSEVVAGSPADRAGLRVGDQWTHVDHHAASSLDEVAALMGRHACGDRVTLTYVRGAETHRTRVILSAAERAADPASAATTDLTRKASGSATSRAAPVKHVADEGAREGATPPPAAIHPAEKTGPDPALQAQLAALQAENAALQDVVQELRKTVEDLQQKIAEMTATHAARQGAPVGVAVAPATGGVTRIEIRIDAPGAEIQVVHGARSTADAPR